MTITYKFPQDRESLLLYSIFHFQREKNVGPGQIQGHMQKENHCNNHYRTFSCLTLSRKILWIVWDLDISQSPLLKLAIFLTVHTTMPFLSSFQLPTSVANSFLTAKYTLNCTNCSSVLLLHISATIKWKRQEKTELFVKRLHVTT